MSEEEDIPEESRIYFKPAVISVVYDDDDNAYVSVTDLVGNIGMLRAEIEEKGENPEYLIAAVSGPWH